MTYSLRPGLLVLHGNRVELLAQAVFSWLAENPMDPLEDETILVQSNGVAEWIKMEMASSLGICASTRVELPARFIWRVYRAVLGSGSVPPVSPLDKRPLVWRLMRLLPVLAANPDLAQAFAPVARFLADGSSTGSSARRLQLAQRLADLFDQYQVYRSDWLQDWAVSVDQLRGSTGLPDASVPVPPDQQWQPIVWRAALEGLTEQEQESTRPLLHQRFLDALQTTPQEGRWPSLPRRIILFGTTHLPHQTLEAIAALSAHVQVLMAVPNPCRYHWADTIDGRTLLSAVRRRHPGRGTVDLATIPLQDMHAHGHPLLSSWGRQARDFVRQLDAFDDVHLARTRFEVPRVDLFDEHPGTTLLEQVQSSIRDLVPLAEHARVPPDAGDRSIVFHVAHSAQREVEILHDQLLHLMSHPPGGQPVHPRDIVVMVPDIDTFAPAIRSVFGQHGRGHPRQIPWGISDQRDRGHHPLLLALEWLLKAPLQRFSLSELRDFLDVPAVAQRLGLSDQDLPILSSWITQSGVRWGLHAEHRRNLDLQACEDANTWQFGLRRMLLGYATGALQTDWAGVQPFPEVAGLSAWLAGVLAELVDALDAWLLDASVSRSPTAWCERLRTLIEDFFEPADDNDRALISAVDEALSSWSMACDAASFDEPLDLAVVREAWLSSVDEPDQVSGGRRFKAGGVTFCTLMPMRSIPFEVVCLLGMNDGDYPRSSSRSDFDLMALPGISRPGDRSRRDDDRQLMLDALLSARRVLYVSWTGRSQRDNQIQPPSVLIAQLRDYLAAGWGKASVHSRTTEHPLQPFSRVYFEVSNNAEPSLLRTYASEWRAAHVEQDPSTGVAEPDPASAPAVPHQPLPPVTLEALARFVKNPVRQFFATRLQVSFDDREGVTSDDEVFVTAGLDRWQLLEEVLRDLRVPSTEATARSLSETVQQHVARLKRAGRLPIAGPGSLVQQELAAVLTPMVVHCHSLHVEHHQVHDKIPVHLSHPEADGLALDDWLVGLRSFDPNAPVWIELQASTLCDDKLTTPRADKLVEPWLRCLAAAACCPADSVPAAGILIGSNAVLRLTPPSREQATSTLHALLAAFADGMNGDSPVPTAVLTGVAFLNDPGKARGVYEGNSFGGSRGEGKDPSLSRLYPGYAALVADPQFDTATRRLYQPYLEWLKTSVTIQALPDHVSMESHADE